MTIIGLFLALLAFILLGSWIAVSMAFVGAGLVGHCAWRTWQSSVSARPVVDDTLPAAVEFPDFPVSSPTSRLQLLRELGWLVVPFVVAASFGAMTDRSTLLSGWRLTSPTVGLRLPHTPPQPAKVETDLIPVSTVSTNGSTTRPAWVDQPRVIEGDCERIVLTSSQYSTKEEAEQELQFAAVKLVEVDLQRIQSGPFRPKYWRPEAEAVIAHAVTQRHDDVTERDFGSFTHPMHCVSWQVELSPRVRTEFIPAWRRELISFRILLVAGVASLFAMVVSASVLYFRLDALTHGRARGPLKLLTGGLTAGWLALVAISFSQGHW